MITCARHGLRFILGQGCPECVAEVGVKTPAMENVCVTRAAGERCAACDAFDRWEANAPRTFTIDRGARIGEETPPTLRGGETPLVNPPRERRCYFCKNAPALDMSEPPACVGCTTRYTR